MTPLEMARHLHALGLCVIPVPRPDGHHDGKRPSIAWSEFQKRQPTKAEITTWFGGMPMNIAIVCGAVSGIVVVDLDGKDACRWWVRHRPATPWRVRTGRGWHVYYGHAGTPIRNRARLETTEGRLPIDVRGDGGYVIGPGSIHVSGTEYEMVGDWSQPLDRLPRFWPGWIARPQPTRPSTPPTSSTARDVRVRARAYLAAIPRPEIGCGSDHATLYAACRLVRGFGLSPAEAEDLLWAWAGGRPGWTRNWIACKVRHAERYGTEPIGGLLA